MAKQTLADRIKSAFQSEGQFAGASFDYITDIIRITTLRDEDQPAQFGFVLYSIAADLHQKKDAGPAIEYLLEHLERGVNYRSLYGVEKITERDISGMMNRLTDKQRAVAQEFVRLVIFQRGLCSEEGEEEGWRWCQIEKLLAEGVPTPN